ncbi:MAG: Uma2 family endonuclease [Burkholderiales bacterium]|nr:Uma2 family endonuclease [Anaerolineae bacterium]
MAQAPEQTKLMTLDELLALGDAHIDVINGEVIDKAEMGVLHHLILGNVYSALDRFVKVKEFGEVFPYGLTYLMCSPFDEISNAFIPDVSYLRLEDLRRAIWKLELPYPDVPYLAVEVISPREKAYNIQNKLYTYLVKGTEQVWIIYPKTREIYQYRRDNNPEIRIYRASGLESIDAESLFPGLQLTTDDIFKLPTWAQQ